MNPAHLFTISVALLLLAAVTTSHASVLAYEGFSGAGANTLGTINGYAPGTSAIGLTGSWSLTSNGNEDVIARNTQDFRGITGGYTPDFVGSRQHWWEHQNVWGGNRANIAMTTPVNLFADGVWYMSFFCEAGNSDYIAQLGLSNASTELMWGQGYTSGLTAYIGGIDTNAQTNNNNTQITHSNYDTLLYVARLTKTNSGTTNNLSVDIKVYNLNALSGLIDGVVPTTWNRTVSLTGVTGSFTNLRAKLDGGGGNYPGMDELRLGQTWSDVTGIPQTIITGGSVAALSTTYGTASTTSSFTVSGTGLSGNLTVTPSTGFETSLNAGSGYGTSTAVTVPASGTLASTTVYVRLAAATVPGAYSGNITVSGGGASSQTVAIPASAVSTKQLTLTGSSVTTKTYDGTTAATITGTLSGVVGTDDVGFVGTGTFDSANAGSGIAVTPVITLNGANASYYTVLQPSGLTGAIDRANQTITFAVLSSRTYGDAPFALTATASSGLPVSYASSNTNVASVSDATLSITGVGSTDITASQAGNGNYNEATAVPQSLTVNQANLTVTGAAVVTKVYDGTTAATITGTLSGVVGTDAVTLVGSGAFDTPSAGTGKAVTSTSTLGGVNAGNYTLTQPTGLSGTILSVYAAWAAANGLPADPSANGGEYLKRFAFGLNPNGSAGTATTSGTALIQTGPPRVEAIKNGTSFSFNALYTRRKDWQSVGLTYSVKFSGDLTNWVSSSGTPTVVASNDDNEAVTVPYPLFVNGLKARFFVVEVGIAP